MSPPGSSCMEAFFRKEFINEKEEHKNPTFLQHSSSTWDTSRHLSLMGWLRIYCAYLLCTDSPDANIVQNRTLRQTNVWTVDIVWQTGYSQSTLAWGIALYHLNDHSSQEGQSLLGHLYTVIQWHHQHVTLAQRSVELYWASNPHLNKLVWLSILSKPKQKDWNKSSQIRDQLKFCMSF